MTGSYRFGIEEEYFISDAITRGTRRKIKRCFFESCKNRFPDEVQLEMLQSQIEVATPPCEDMADARQRLAELRAGLGAIARDHGLVLIAAGTHPTAMWAHQRATEAARYDKLMRDLQMLGSRNIVCGLHVHVEVPDPSRRVDLMTRCLPYMPLLLALSTSSPFWQAQRTGLLGYRLAAYRELPRTWLPDLFAGQEDYDRYVETLVSAGAIDNASFVWWVVRPSLQHPTLELRVADSCTHLDDAIAIAALYRALVRHLDRNPSVNAGMTGASRAIIAENCWRAQRYGVHGSFVDERTRSARSVGETLDAVIAMLADDARALGCLREVQCARTIVARGTSADRQLALYMEARGRGLDRHAALLGVVDWLALETVGTATVEPRVLAAVG
ncbi:carboxylate-amine ligase [Chelatococcus sp. SYSU_G07232]|uniref:Putative glutamate--cysteine ligase 2 n=1 Tax=Chelatococcus albus TaxID=3047466 RepID=A0ABT7ALG4_9HYPH|nr:carboxylate-amine ligase [Chelatococcus sp. SYSU_G07232]MDJ1160228.1 carboxylate-amine ligase [Chelatococcus sp. SYSU_G07232]